MAVNGLTIEKIEMKLVRSRLKEIKGSEKLV